MKSEIFTAAESGKIGLLRSALVKGANINEQDENGTTPLMIACKLGYLELVKFIFSKGAKISITDKKGLNAANYAELGKNKEILDYFFEIGVIQYSTSKQTNSTNYNDIGKNILPVLDNLKTISKLLNDDKRELLSNDFFKVIMLFRQDKKLSIYDGLGLALAISVINDPKDFGVNDGFLNDSEKVTETINQFFLSIDEKIKNSKTTTINFEIKAFNYLNNNDVVLLKKTIYEFSEIIVKADGIVTEEEATTLKFLSNKIYKTNVETQLKTERVEAKKIDEVLEELNGLVGMSNIKSDINSLINIITINKLRKREGLPEQKLSLHSVFMGPPGTGKTTIARILSKIYHSLEILPDHNFVETDRSDLVAGYVGQTAIKTDNIINQALNGVLFIDEAYTLKRSDSGNDYGQEAIDILLKKMEDYRDKLIVIVAGYENEMGQFINSNPGLKSRFNRYFYFKDYSPDELTEIYSRMAKKTGFVIPPSASAKILDLFTALHTKKDDRFGNARLARNIFEKTFEKHANRTATIAPITREILTTIEPDDIPFDEFLNSKYL